MAETKIYTIPLRREFQKASHKRKTNKAIRALKQYVEKHAKADKILIGEELNEYLWSRGISNPPAKVQVEITTEVKKEESKETKEAFVNLVGFGKKVVTQSKKGILSKENSGLQGKLKDAVATLKGTKDSKAETVEPVKEATEKKATPVKEEVKAEKPKAPAKATPKAEKVSEEKTE